MTSGRIMAIVGSMVLVAAVLSGSGFVRIGIDRGASIGFGDLPDLDGEFTPIPEPHAVATVDPRCSVADRIDEALTMLSEVTLDVGDTDIEYWEVRNGNKRIFSDPEKEFALVVLHRDVCELELITITKRGDELIAPSGWSIEAVERPSGIRWNNWNTEFHISRPSNAVVVANIEPFIVAERPGQRVTSSDVDVRTVYTTSRAIEYRPYVPYSRDLHNDELVSSGQDYLHDVVARAYARLLELGVRSKAFPERLVSELPYLNQEMFVRLPIIEHADLLEFVLEPKRVVERVFVIIGGNEEDAFTFTCSHAGACGMMQFTDANGRGTYSLMRDRYPAARLELDFEQGAKNHLNAMMAAILLHDNNLNLLVDTFGESIVDDPKLEEYLAALYNASPAAVIPAIRTARAEHGDDWSDYLPSRIQQETGGYIVKLRYLMDTDDQYATRSSESPI